MAFLCLAIMSTLLAMPHAARALATSGNSTRTAVGLGSTNLNLTTGAVVTFIILLLGLAAAFLLIGRFQKSQKRSQDSVTVDTKSTEADEVAERARSKRNFLKLMLTLGGVATLGTFASIFRILEYVPAPGQGSRTTVALAWPEIKLVNISTLDPSKPLRFNYPLVDTPCVLVKCGQKADYGVGPDSDIVAFNDICQHLGCFYAVLPPGSSPPCDATFLAATPQGYCCCHGGQYDFVHAGTVIGGPPPRSVPQVVLRFDASTGDIYAVGMGGPTIFGHGPPGTTDPALVLKYDLTGGTVVTDATVFS
ncbi:MAG: Rieske 2Fe-2S domain-containing protein [Thaumarchaeota archaeon]|nr:Rieske 2Fe-2S domain-containing protein [Nitrososphaerota archaeon]